MPKLSDLAVRTLSPANYRFTASVFQAVQVRSPMLEDFVIDFGRFEPAHRSVEENDLLRLNDVVVGFTGREMTAVGIYHPQTAFPEPVTLSSYTLAFRAGNLAEAVAILAGLIYALNRRRELSLSDIRALPVTFFTDEQVTNFLTLLKTVHEVHTNARKREKLLRELIPTTIHKFLNDAKEETKQV